MCSRSDPLENPRTHTGRGTTCVLHTSGAQHCSKPMTCELGFRLLKWTKIKNVAKIRNPKLENVCRKSLKMFIVVPPWIHCTNKSYKQYEKSSANHTRLDPHSVGGFVSNDLQILFATNVPVQSNIENQQVCLPPSQPTNQPASQPDPKSQHINPQSHAGTPLSEPLCTSIN